MSKIGKRAILLLLALPIGFNVMAQETKNRRWKNWFRAARVTAMQKTCTGCNGGATNVSSRSRYPLFNSTQNRERNNGYHSRANQQSAWRKQGRKIITPVFRPFPWADKPQMLFTIAGKFIVYDFKNNQVVSTFKPKDGANNEDYCAVSGNVAYTIDNNLYVNEKAVTNEPEGIVCGQTVHRNEFGINKGTFWSRKVTCSLSTVWMKAWWHNTRL